jgi:hypothetical protein
MEIPEMTINNKLSSPSINLFDNQPEKSSRVDQILPPLESDWRKTIEDFGNKLRIRKVDDATAETLMLSTPSIVIKGSTPTHSLFSGQSLDYSTWLGTVKCCHSVDEKFLEVSLTQLCCNIPQRRLLST